MLNRNLIVLALLFGLVVPVALGAPKAPANPDDSDAYVNEAGDDMTGNLEMGRNAVTWMGEPLASPSAGALTFGGVAVCLESGNCPDAVDGGDAATLAGLSPSAFLRRDATDTFVGGVLTISPTSVLDARGPVRVGSASGADDDLVFFDDGAAEWFGWRDAGTTFEVSDELYVAGHGNAEGDFHAQRNLATDSGLVYLNGDGPDADQWMLFYDDGALANEWLGWRDSADRFEVSNDLFIGGHANAEGDFNAGRNLAMRGNQLWFNSDGPDADQWMLFYDDGVAAREWIAWREGSDQFEFSDDVLVTGSVGSASSALVKRNVTDLVDALSAVLALRGVEYDSLLSERHEIGLIAEEVALVAPEVVLRDSADRPWAVDYGRLVALLVEAIAEQQLLLDAHETRLDAKDEQFALLNFQRVQLENRLAVAEDRIDVLLTNQQQIMQRLAELEAHHG